VVSQELQRLARLLGRIHLHSQQRTVNSLSHRCVLRYLRRTHRDLIDAYRSMPPPTPDDHGVRVAWTLWWQGESSAPDLIRMCLESLRENLTGVELRVVTRENVRTYATISDNMIRRLDRGNITMTQFSDVVRTALLSRHGGIWLDATVMTLHPVPESVFDQPFYTRKTYPNQHYLNVSDRRWSAWLLGGTPRNATFAFMNDMFEEYWRLHQRPLHYFHVDYLLALAYEEDLCGLRTVVDGLDYNNARTYDLLGLLAQPFDFTAFRDVRESDTHFYKLNRRISFEPAGSDSLYAHLRRACDE
jgi:Capsular polysaccharide synthesis protein